MYFADVLGVGIVIGIYTLKCATTYVGYPTGLSTVVFPGGFTCKACTIGVVPEFIPSGWGGRTAITADGYLGGAIGAVVNDESAFTKGELTLRFLLVLGYKKPLDFLLNNCSKLLRTIHRILLSYTESSIQASSISKLVSSSIYPNKNK